MNLKKTLAGLLSLAMVTATMAVPVFAAETKISVSSQDGLEDAIKQATADDVIVLGEGEYTTYGTSYAQGKTLTFEGAVDSDGKPLTVWKYGSFEAMEGEHGSDYSFSGSNVTFKNIRFFDNYSDNASYRGFTYLNSIAFENCEFNSLITYLGPNSATFKDCTFNSTGSAYSLWIYSIANITFDGCTMNVGNRFANCYDESAGGNTKIIVKDCTLNAQSADKAAFNLKNSNDWDVGFLGENKISGLEADSKTGSAWFQSETGSNTVIVSVGNTEEDAVVIWDGVGGAGEEAKTAYYIEPEAFQPASPSGVAEVGGEQYETLEMAVDACPEGETITLLADATGNGIKINKSLTIDLGGYTYTVDNNTVGSLGTETQAFQLLKNNDVKIMNGTICTTAAKMLVQNYSNLTLENVTLDGSGLVGEGRYTLSNNNGNITFGEGTKIIAKSGSGNFAYDLYDWASGEYSGITLEIGNNVTIIGNTEVGGDRDSDKTKLSIKVKAANRNQLPTAPDGYAWNLDGDVYKLAEAEPEIVIEDKDITEAVITGEVESGEAKEAVKKIVAENDVVNSFANSGIKEAVEAGKTDVIAALQAETEVTVPDDAVIESNVQITLKEANVAKADNKVFSNKMVFDVCPTVTTEVGGTKITAKIHNPAKPITICLPVADYYDAGTPAKVTHTPENEPEEVFNTVVKSKGGFRYVEVTLNSFSDVTVDVLSTLAWKYDFDSAKYGPEGEQLGVARFLYDSGIDDKYVAQSKVFFFTFGEFDTEQEKAQDGETVSVKDEVGYGAFSADLNNINLENAGRTLYSIGFINVDCGETMKPIWSEVQSAVLNFDRIVNY